MSSDVWRLNGHRATLEVSSLRAALDVASPGAGVHDIRFASHEWPNLRVSQIHLPGTASPTVDIAEIAEAYIRGDDLVVTYSEKAARPYRVQVYWRVVEFSHESQSLVGWETIVSVQTSRWDMDPRMELKTVIDGSYAMTSALPGTIAVGYGGQGYLEILHPAGSHSSECRPSANKGWDMTHTLFGGFLEKGVILRARLLCLFAPMRFDESLIVQLRDEFLASEPVLTA